MSAEQILKMIESVDSSDTAKLDEIDARVWCWWQGNCEYLSHRSSELFGAVVKFRQIEESIEYPAGHEHVESNVPKYTRSRDALKGIRPEGWRWVVGTNNICGDYESTAQFHCSLFNGNYEVEYVQDFPTEELAELHAIIQAIEYERTAK